MKQIHSILYWLNKKDFLGTSVYYPESDAQFLHWEKPVKDWVISHGFIDETDAVIPKEYDDVHKPEYAPKISVTNFDSNKTYSLTTRINIGFQNNQSRFNLSKVDVFINDIFMGSVKSSPFNFSFTPNDVDNIKTENELKLVVYDTVKNKAEYTIPLKLEI